MSEARKGILAMVLACSIWGLSAMFYKALAHVPPLEVLSHRTIWSFVFFVVLIAVQGRLSDLSDLFRHPKLLMLIGLGAVLISTNWFVFIYSVQVGRAVEASLGYYIFPLVAVVLGAVVFRERLSKTQWSAVALAAIAVAVLTWGLGVTPWLSLALAFSFGFYGVVKKKVSSGPVLSVTAEVMLLLPLAIAWLWGVHSQSWGGLVGRNVGAFGGGWLDSMLLILAGPMTAIPLMLFSYATKRAPYATVGLVQYLNPTLQGLVAVMVFGELFTLWHIIAFGLIWTGLALYSSDVLRRPKPIAT
ncbi:EamA family transporter RarD [Aliiroseovarius sp. YM-037]|uniref:EamA family transporter RarD n=1 Tax=Aliiroseovarius sp. YM-037 TaxID=3341728 RepID=UPI003A80AF4E